MHYTLQMLEPQWLLLMFIASQVTLTCVALSVALVVQRSAAPEIALLQCIVFGLGCNGFCVGVECVQKDCRLCRPSSNPGGVCIPKVC